MFNFYHFEAFSNVFWDVWFNFKNWQLSFIIYLVNTCYSLIGSSWSMLMFAFLSASIAQWLVSSPSDYTIFSRKKMILLTLDTHTQSLAPKLWSFITHNFNCLTATHQWVEYKFDEDQHCFSSTYAKILSNNSKNMS